MKQLRIFHISTVHPACDPRIAYRQLPTLAAHYDVWAALPGARLCPDVAVHFINLPAFRRVFIRVVTCYPLLIWHLLRIRPVIVHVYDPELLPLGFLANWCGLTVIYEVHENLRLKFNRKAINNGWLLEHLFDWFDRKARQHFHLILTEESYQIYYSQTAFPVTVVRNFPNQSMFESFRQPYRSGALDDLNLLYMGVVSFDRALDTLVQAVAQLVPQYPALRVHLFGRCAFAWDELEAIPEFALVRQHLVFYGYTDQVDALPYAARCVAGLALLKPVGDYPDSYPTKLFEYMALGLPVLTADFPLYQAVVEPIDCGFCVDATKAAQVADRLAWLFDHPAEAEAMGTRGQLAVEQLYNWTNEQNQLLNLYQKLHFINSL